MVEELEWKLRSILFHDFVELGGGGGGGGGNYSNIFLHYAYIHDFVYISNSISN